MYLPLQEVLDRTYLLDTAEPLNAEQMQSAAAVLLRSITSGELPARVCLPKGIAENELAVLAGELSVKHREAFTWPELSGGIPARFVAEVSMVPASDWLVDYHYACSILRDEPLLVRGVMLNRAYMVSSSSDMAGKMLQPYTGELMTLPEASDSLARAGLPALTERDWWKSASTGALPLWWHYDGPVRAPGQYDEQMSFNGKLRAHAKQLEYWLNGYIAKSVPGLLYESSNGRAYQPLDALDIPASMLRIRRSDLQAMLDAAKSGVEGQKAASIGKQIEAMQQGKASSEIDASKPAVRARLILEKLFKDHGIKEPIPNEGRSGGVSDRPSGKTYKREMKDYFCKTHKWTESGFEKAWEIIEREK